MHYDQLLTKAMARSEPSVLWRLALDIGARALHFEPSATPENTRELEELLDLARAHASSPAPAPDQLRARVDTLWDTLDDFSSHGLGTAATAIGWAMSMWEPPEVAVREAADASRAVASARGVPAEIKRSYHFFAGDNEEIWHARRLEALEEAFLSDALWTVREDEIPACARIDYDPLVQAVELLEQQRALPEADRARMRVWLECLADDGWFVRREDGLLLCADGPPELAENIWHDAIVVDPGGRAPLRIL